MHDLVFVNRRTGEPAKNSSYDTHLYKLCDEAGIKRFLVNAIRQFQQATPPVTKKGRKKGVQEI
ncbi:hypothetical protein [Eshraghiella crossota]|uniref:hypothetical protein n=1 Tax=Eshraghiella crossota TaxID=45851 RepID=UPI003F810427